MARSQRVEIGLSSQSSARRSLAAGVMIGSQRVEDKTSFSLSWTWASR
jgi:hypothetical protein